MSGSTIGSVVGGVIGFYVGGAQGFQVGWMIGGAVGGYVDPDVIKGPKIGDAQVQTSMEGVPRPIIYGTAVVAGNIIQCQSELTEHRKRERTGKGGPVQETYFYTRTVAIRICEGEIGGILRIWQDDKLVYDVRDPSEWPDDASAIVAMAADTAKFASGITVYTGSESQSPDPSLESLPIGDGGGVGNVPSYRGTAYVVFTDLVCDGGRTPQFRFEVSKCGSVIPVATQWWLTSANSNDTLNKGSSLWTTTDFSTWQGPFTRSPNDAAHPFYGPVPIGGTMLIAGSETSIELITDHNFADGVTTTGKSVGAELTRVRHHENTVVGLTGTNTYFVSTDAGESWVSHTAPGAGILVDAVFIQDPLNPTSGRWAANLSDGPSSRYVYSGDLVSWTNATQPVGWTPSVGAIACGGAVAAHFNTSGQGCKTADGLVWQRVTDLPIAANGGRDAIGYGSILIVAIEHVSGSGVARSLDSGDTWTYDISISPDFQVERIERGNGRLVVSYPEITSGVCGAYSDDDGVTWTEFGAPYVTSSGDKLRVAFGNDTYSGLSIPDVPSFIVGTDGVISGPRGDIVTACSAVLSDVITDICERVGLTASQLDVTQCTDDVRGFIVAQQMPAGDAIRSLQQGYFFDFPEWGDYTDTSTKLRAIKRGGASAFAITDADLVQSDEDEETRAQAVEFPRKINLVTPDAATNYEPNKQTAARRTDDVRAVGEATVQLPIVFDPDERAQKADIMLRVAWEEAAGRCTFTLPEEYSALVPSDCFTKDGKRWRAIRCEYGDGTVKVEAVRDRASAYVSTAAGTTSATVPPPVASVRGPTLFAAMNLPSLRAGDNVPGMYVAAQGLLSGWVGCDLQLSVDGGATYQSVLTMTSAATMGELAADCASSGEPISVQVYIGGELDSITADQIAARQNAFAIVSSGTAEVGQFQTATEDGTTDRLYDLTDVTRGELDTTAAAHAAGDRFVLLDGAVYFLPIDPIHAGNTLKFRPVSLGTVAANATVYDVTFDPPTFIIDGGEVT